MPPGSAAIATDIWRPPVSPGGAPRISEFAAPTRWPPPPRPAAAVSCSARSFGGPLHGGGFGGRRLPGAGRRRCTTRRDQRQVGDRAGGGVAGSALTSAGGLQNDRADHDMAAAGRSRGSKRLNWPLTWFASCQWGRRFGLPSPEQEGEALLPQGCQRGWRRGPGGPWPQHFVKRLPGRGPKLLADASCCGSFWRRGAFAAPAGHPRGDSLKLEQGRTGRCGGS